MEPVAVTSGRVAVAATLARCGVDALAVLSSAPPGPIPEPEGVDRDPLPTKNDLAAISTRLVEVAVAEQMRFGDGGEGQVDVDLVAVVGNRQADRPAGGRVRRGIDDVGARKSACAPGFALFSGPWPTVRRGPVPGRDRPARRILPAPPGCPLT
ncbi:hypothetical protein [Mycobacterium sp. DBP42]|uniref:hypothetical protein n=1 Tax=Mycobacterium sp. DBP42 TaxID=2545267 RepID=UPI00190EA477|nr:hypothetical protein [Mycobacterium sp. DBP42]